MMAHIVLHVDVTASSGHEPLLIGWGAGRATIRLRLYVCSSTHLREVQMRQTKTTAYYISPIEIGVL